MEENNIVTTIMEILSQNLPESVSVTDIETYVEKCLKDNKISNLSRKVRNGLKTGLDFGLFSIAGENLYKLKFNPLTDVPQSFENSFNFDPMSESEENMEHASVKGNSVLSIQKASRGPGKSRNQRRGRSVSSSKYRRMKPIKKGRGRRTRRGGRSGPGRTNTPTKKRRSGIVTKKRQTRTRN